MPSLNLLIKPSSSNCNLKCTYCFYDDVSENREVKSHGFMSIEALSTMVKTAMEYSDSIVNFAFQGGEPTLIGLDFYKELLELQYKYNHKNLIINNSIQTNGILIDEKWAKFLGDNRFLVGLSLDGPKDINDTNRVDFRNNGSFNKIQKTIQLFDKYNVDYNILTVVTKNVARHVVKVYNHFSKSNFKFLQFIPCLDNLGVDPGTNPYSLSPKDYEDFLKKLFDLWYKDIERGRMVSIRFFDNILLSLMGRPTESCDMNGRCTVNSTIESDGSVYPCDFYVLDRWKLGNVNTNTWDEILNSDSARDFVDESLPINDKCENCKYFLMCKGGCRRHYEPIGDNVLKNNYFCESYLGFYEYTLDRFTLIANKLKQNL